MRALPPFFLLRSDDVPQHDLLTGYFFDGADLYVDQPLEGPFPKSREARLPDDLDGIYVAVEVRKGQVRITTDHAGTVPLFLYENRGFWAVSPSFKKLLDLAKARGDRLDIVPDVLRAWRIRGHVGQFPRNFQTCFAEIKLVPSYCDLIGTDRSITMVPRKRESGRDYRSELETYREITAGRFRTIVESGGHLALDITGGIDSRTILAAALEAFGAPELQQLNREGRFTLRSNPNLEIDLPIAQELAEKLGLDLSLDEVWDVNTLPERDDGAPAERAAVAPGPLLSEEALLALWGEQRIGRWAVVGVDRRQWLSRVFSTSGVFGGNLKSPNPSEVTVEDGRRYLSRFETHFDSAELFQTWRERVISDVKTAQAHTGGERLPFWPLFNREFLMRLHAGQYLGSHRLYPLASKHLADAVNLLDSTQLADLRVHHDLIHAASRVLYQTDYDMEQKKPKDTFEPTSLDRTPRHKAGRFHGAKDIAAPQDGLPRATEDQNLYRLARHRALELSQRQDIRDLMGKKYCNRVLKIVSGLSTESGQGIAYRDHSLIHGPHLAEMILSLKPVSDREPNENNERRQPGKPVAP